MWSRLGSAGSSPFANLPALEQLEIDALAARQPGFPPPKMTGRDEQVALIDQPLPEGLRRRQLRAAPMRSPAAVAFMSRTDAASKLRSIRVLAVGAD